MDEQLPEPIPAATLVVFREVAAGPPEILIVERARAMAFAGGMLVFPGGRIDPGDRALATTLGGDAEDLAARIAAVRETIEEAGIAVGLSQLPDGDTLETMRASLHDGQSFGAVLNHAGHHLDLQGIVPFARWLPRHAHMRIFDTRFYLARLPAGAPEPRVDATENSRAFWASAADVLAMCDRGEAAVIFPTRRNLERLAQYESFDEAADDARSRPDRVVTPWTEERDGADYLCIPDDLGYPVTAEALSGAMRG
ncbi:MAG TPA: NUDIX hydrolase [Sphingomicrobium sp.]